MSRRAFSSKARLSRRYSLARSLPLFPFARSIFCSARSIFISSGTKSYRAAAASLQQAEAADNKDFADTYKRLKGQYKT